jgi:hypothetical protein
MIPGNTHGSRLESPRRMKPLKIVKDHPKKDPNLGVESKNATFCSLKGMRNRFEHIRTSSIENSLIASLKGVQTLSNVTFEGSFGWQFYPLSEFLNSLHL